MQNHRKKIVRVVSLSREWVFVTFCNPRKKKNGFIFVYERWAIKMGDDGLTTALFSWISMTHTQQIIFSIYSSKWCFIFDSNENGGRFHSNQFIHNNFQFRWIPVREAKAPNLVLFWPKMNIQLLIGHWPLNICTLWWRLSHDSHDAF